MVRAPSKPPLKVRLKALLDEYGPVAFVVYFAIYAATFAAFAAAISMGVSVEGAGGAASTYGGAWVAAKLTQPLRILATLVLTPVVGKVWRKFRPVKK